MIAETDFFRIAVITGAHGLNGRIKIKIVTDFSERFTPGNIVYIKTENNFIPHTISDFTYLKGKNSLLGLKEITTIEEALALKGSELHITSKQAEETRGLLQKDEFYCSDIILCDVYHLDEHFGIVIDIFEGGAGDILIIETDKTKRVMIPFVDSMVDTSRLEHNRIDIHPVEGLFDI